MFAIHVVYFGFSVTLKKCILCDSPFYREREALVNMNLSIQPSSICKIDPVSDSWLTKALSSWVPFL